MALFRRTSEPTDAPGARAGTDTRTDPALRDDRVRDDRVRDDRVRDDRVRDDRVRDDRVREPVAATPAGRVVDEDYARRRYGGANWGAAFFGWLVTVGMTVLLTGIIGAVAAAVGYSNGVTQTDAQRNAGTVTFVTALVLFVVLLVAYYSGGYVAGRMSRFEGGRQGFLVWLVGLLITVIAAALGAVGRKYDLYGTVNLPRIPVPTQTVTVAGILVAVAVLLVTILAAVLGGKVGRRYHLKVDRAAY